MNEEITLEQLYEMQKALDARIIKEKGLEGVDLLPNTVLALQVEIAELANEWRGFKHWSNDREPRTKVEVGKCLECDGTGDENFHTLYAPFESCLGCAGTGMKHKNPLLEEFVDCVHFFLSIARQNDWLEHMYVYEGAIDETREEGLDGGIGGAFLELIYWLSKMHMENAPDEKIEQAFGYSKKVFCFKNAWYVFVAIGLVGFGFNFDQIAAAYVAKNEENHARQLSGY